MLRDLRQATRTLRSWRLSAGVAVATLAIGIGTATSMYALVRMALESTTPRVDDLPRLARIYASSRTLGIERGRLTPNDLDVLASATSFESIGAYTSDDGGEMTIGGESIEASLGQVSLGFFPAMRARAAAGRLLLADDFRARRPVAVISDRLWRKHFTGQPMGRAVVTIDGRPRTIVGVLPADFGFPFIGISGDVWVPLERGPNDAARSVAVLARLKRDSTWTAAAAELAALARPRNPNGLWTWSAITVEQDVRTRTVGGFAMMFGPALVVLLIACTNVACMLLGRGVDRDAELSVRSALGATRSRIVRQLLVEHLVLALTGGALGVGLAYALVRVVTAAVAQFGAASLVLPASRLVWIGFCVSLAACLLFGTLPAVRLSRRDLATSLKGGTTPAVARFVGYRARDLVVFVELGLAVVLVVTTAMFTRFFAEIERVTPLFPADRIVAADVAAAEAGDAAARIAAVPGVRSVTVSSGVPGRQRASSAASIRADNGRGTRAALVGAEPALFRTLGIPVLRGRVFDRSEADGQARVTIVSTGVASRLWPGADPLGARLTIVSARGTTTATVVGVAGDALDGGSLARTGLLPPEVYLPRDVKETGEVSVLCRTEPDGRLLVRPVAAAARADSTGRMPYTRVLETSLVRADTAFAVRLFVGFSAIALLLAGTGIFGVISQSVAQRRTEFGVRMAMGASSRQVLRMVLAREAKLILAAVGTGVVGTVLVTRFGFAEMLTITGTDPLVWLAVAAPCGGVAALAVGLATRRIVKLVPSKILRQA